MGAPFREGCRRGRPGGGSQVRQPGRKSRHSLHTVAPAGRPRFHPDRRRGLRRDDDGRQRHGEQLERLLHHRLQDAFARGWKSRPDDLSETTKLFSMMGKYMQQKYHGHYYSKAQNLRRTLKAAYDEALREYDLLVLPTLLRKPTPLPGPDATREEIVTRAFETNYNTSPFNMTGNPAMNVPCGKDRRPAGGHDAGRPLGRGRHGPSRRRCLRARRRRRVAFIPPTRPRRFSGGARLGPAKVPTRRDFRPSGAAI